MNNSNLKTSEYHLPYYRDLVDRAKELRRNMTPAEKKLWNEYLRTFPFRILRQRPIDRFIVDFYCSALKLVIEIDGDSHYTEQGIDRDRERTQILEGYGLKVIRFTNRQVLYEFEAVCEFLNCWISVSSTGDDRLATTANKIPLNPP